MENKLGRKSMQGFMTQARGLSMDTYQAGFTAGYESAKDETPDVDEMANILIDSYTDYELGELRFILDHEGSRKTIESANQQRAELIQRAREFVDEQAGDNFHFEVNQEKRTVFAWKVIREGRGYDALTGLAVCNPSDVFNEWIGKAIALARALEIGVPVEFLKAVQPDEVVVGMKVAYPDELRRGIMTVIDYSKDRNYPSNETKLSVAKDINTRIIDDTNAQY